MGETTNLNWWTPDFWTIKSMTKNGENHTLKAYQTKHHRKPSATNGSSPYPCDLLVQLDQA